MLYSFLFFSFLSFIFFFTSFFLFWTVDIINRHYICTVTGLDVVLQSHNSWLIWAFSWLHITNCLSPLYSGYYSHLLFLYLIFPLFYPMTSQYFHFIKDDNYLTLMDKWMVCGPIRHSEWEDWYPRYTSNRFVEHIWTLVH